MGLALSAVIAVCTWAASIRSRDVSIVDIIWGFLVLAPACVLAVLCGLPDTRARLVLLLATIWALRLSAHIAWRGRGQAEDRRYQAIRRRNEPYFEFKSLYLVFGLQTVLAWVVSLPIMLVIARPAPPRVLDVLGFGLLLFGLVFESIADYQLARFKSAPANRGRVMNQGLWRYSRHPNYFGECCVWWGFGLIALATGAWWTIVSPLLITWLLLRVSGVTLIEKDIVEHRPAYRDYIRTTNSFLPGRPRA